MAPAIPSKRPRGRPRKAQPSLQAINIDSSPASSRVSSTTRRSTRLASDNLSSPYFSKQTRNLPSEINASYEESSDLPSPSMLGHFSSAMKGKGKATAGRESLSSVNTSNDYNEASDYSTPATSGFTTPATAVNTSTGRKRRGRAATAMSTINPAFRGGPAKTTNKRMRDEDEEDADEDNTADARLARQLQAEEDAKGLGGMASKSTPKKRGRQRKATFTSRFETITSRYNDKLDVFGEDMPSAKRPKVELSSKSNAVSFKANKPIILDSDADDDILMISSGEEDDEPFVVDSDSDDVPLAISTPRNRKIAVPKTRSSGKAARTAIASLSREQTRASTVTSGLTSLDSDFDDGSDSDISVADLRTALSSSNLSNIRRGRGRREMLPDVLREDRKERRAKIERTRLVNNHPELNTMWKELEDLPKIGQSKIEQPTNINRQLKPFQLEGVAWMRAMEDTEWGGGLLGDEMGMGKTIQAVSLIMSDFPATQPSLVLIPPVALMQWQQEIADYTDGTLKTFVYHGTNKSTKGILLKDLKKYNVILMSYNSLESMYRKQEKGFQRKGGIHKEKSLIHQIHFHRVILDEAHNIKQRTSGSAKACFALKADHKWCLSGTPLQNRIGEFFSLVRFLDIRPFACYFCKQCPCSTLEWGMNENNKCKGCDHSGMQHVSVFNQELLNPIQKFGNFGPGKEAFKKLRILTDRFMLRRVKRDHSSAMELPAKEIHVDRHFFGEEENDFAGSIMNNGTRKFETYVAQGVLLNNYANIFGLIMQMRQVADHPDLILKKNGEGGQNILVCCICDETAEEAIRSSCRHDFCRECAKNYLKSSESPDCPQCHIALSIDLEQPELEQDETQVKKSSIINRIKMENWTSSSKIEALVHDLYQLRSKNISTKSIIFSQFTTMLQLVEWRLRRAGITTVMLDGSMTPAQRQASINHFMTDVNVECFLVSLKAGGVALNLTEASHVFIVDPWWNPAAEWQSADRCHRIGQARPCQITRLCIEDSVESRMVLLQEKKANMINSTINADESAMESLTPEDMQFLFRGN